jgi:hypothetical protein
VVTPVSNRFFSSLLTRGGESSEDIFWAKKKITEKSMKTLIPVSPKQIFGHYDGCKMDYPKNYNYIKLNPNNIKIPQLRKYTKFHPNQ